MTTLADRLARCYTGAVFDALRERGLDGGILPRDVRPLDDALVMAGPVFTVRGSPKPGLDAHASLLAWTDFLSRAPAGHVVVLEARDDDRALMGELSAETLQGRGVRGFVTDGGCRDVAFIRRIRFPVAARFVTPRDVVGAWSPDAFDEPVSIGGVPVAPGDYLIADVDGAVVVPGAIADELVAEVERVMRTENKVRDAIRAGTDPKEAYLRHGRF